MVVIVVIGILAAITVVAYMGIIQRAIVVSMQSDLTNGSRVIKLYQIEHGSYPTSFDGNNCPIPADSKRCIKPSGNNSFTYQTDGTTNSQTFSLFVTNNSTNYRITSESPPLQVAIICPFNFIVVPGSPTYGTSTFCVMKYEAKQVGATTTPISTAAGLPWVSISQTTAIANSPNVTGCSGCHLITESEWLTIAQNVLGIGSNWSDGVIGSGFIYSGNQYNAPTNPLAADINDGNGYYGEAQSGGNQCRTLTLSNGEIIWDFPGNVWEWTNATIAGGQQPGLSGDSSYGWKEWPDASFLQHGLASSALPSYTGISGSNGWNWQQGIGQVHSNYNGTGTHSFRRGGDWSTLGYYAGVFSLSFDYVPADTGSSTGFRVAK